MYCHSTHSKKISQQMSSRKRSPLMVSTRTNPFTAALLHSERCYHPLNRTTHQSRESHVNAGIWTVHVQSITINCRTAKVMASVLLHSVPRLQKVSPFYSVVKGPLFVLDFLKKTAWEDCVFIMTMLRPHAYIAHEPAICHNPPTLNCRGDRKIATDPERNNYLSFYENIRTTTFS
jgi:hypothetical protein